MYAKGNTMCNVNHEKRKLYLYYGITNAYTEFQVNISKDGKVKSEKMTNRQTDKRRAN